jgi:hypothetical protein
MLVDRHDTNDIVRAALGSGDQNPSLAEVAEVDRSDDDVRDAVESSVLLPSSTRNTVAAPAGISICRLTDADERPLDEQETTGRSTYQTVPPPTEMPPHVSAMKIAANTTGAMPLPLRASPLKRAITARIAATIERAPPRISPMNSGMGMSTRPASANQNAAQAAGLERRSTEEDMLDYLVSAARSP